MKPAFQIAADADRVDLNEAAAEGDEQDNPQVSGRDAAEPVVPTSTVGVGVEVEAEEATGSASLLRS